MAPDRDAGSKLLIFLAALIILVMTAVGLLSGYVVKPLRQLSDLGCEQAQGYFIGKPIALDDLLRWLNNYKATSYTNRRNKKQKFAKKPESSGQPSLIRCDTGRSN